MYYKAYKGLLRFNDKKLSFENGHNIYIAASLKKSRIVNKHMKITHSIQETEMLITMRCYYTHKEYGLSPKLVTSERVGNLDPPLISTVKV